MTQPDTEKTYQTTEFRKPSSDNDDKLRKVLKTEVLLDENDPDIDKSPEERAAIVRLAAILSGSAH